MNPIAWMAIGVGITATLGLVFFAITESDFRTALGQVLGALVAGPAILIAAFATRSLPRAMTLSPEALALFARQQTGAQQPAWLLGYRGRGIIIVRRRTGDGRLNDVPNRASRVKRDTERYRPRPIAEVQDDA